MMIQIAKNRILDAFLKFILLSAIIHTALLAVYSLIFWDIRVFNYFSILAVSLFIPGAASGQVSMIVSGAIMASVFLAIFLFYTKSDKKKNSVKKPMLRSR